VACETQSKYTRQQLRRQETGERLQESYGKQQQKLCTAAYRSYNNKMHRLKTELGFVKIATIK